MITTMAALLVCLSMTSPDSTPVTSTAPAVATVTDLAIVPRPAQMSVQPGEFVISAETQVAATGGATAEAGKLIAALAPAMGFKLALVPADGPRPKAIMMRIDPALAPLGNEGYRLEVAPDWISISAAGAAGLYYGTQTLRQLLAPAIFKQAAVPGSRWAVPCVNIVDRPRFAWRGVMLDPARHFLPKSFILKMIDTMALHKLNSLQLHLTDDQGWRIEIRKYPKLTEVGAWRDETLIGHSKNKPPQYDGKRHGGFYTQDDIREIVRYAADRYINVVPEIEMPGHSQAAIAAYPELSCHPDEPVKVLTKWYISRDVLVPTDKTVAFMQDVLTEVMELFPSKFIHIGGDEAKKDQWKASPLVQARMKELGLKTEEQMQSWFTKQMDGFLAKHGRRLLGWDEILEGGLAPGAVVMSWRGEQGGIEAVKSGHDVVMAQTSHTYLDYYQGPPETEPLAICCMLSLKTVYEYEPIPKELTAEQAKRVLGGQCQLWGEYIPNGKHCEYMAFPRACALAEVLWSPAAGKDYATFTERLQTHLKRLDALEVNYRKLDGK